MNLCTKCLITKPFSIGYIPKFIDYKAVDNTEDNVILKQIMIHGIGPINTTFTIIALGNRYKITIKSKNRRTYILTQEYMHFDRNNGYSPVKWRYVKIIN